MDYTPVISQVLGTTLTLTCGSVTEPWQTTSAQVEEGRLIVRFVGGGLWGDFMYPANLSTSSADVTAWLATVQAELQRGMTARWLLDCSDLVGGTV